MINISSVNFTKLKQIESKKRTVGGSLYHFYLDGNHMAIKKYHDYYNSEEMNKFFHTVSLLMENDIGIEELVVPIDFFSIDSQVSGCIMPYIDGRNLSDILKDFKVSEKDKRKHLKDIGILLEKMDCYRKDSGNPFYLVDLHEDNFIIENGTNRLRVVDLDSCKFMDNDIFTSKYLYLNRNVHKIEEKYPSYDDYFERFVPNKNGDLFCYNIILLNYIANEDVNFLTRNEYYEYLDYLQKVGISYELLNSFDKLYTPHDNINPYQFIDDMPSDMGKASYKVFKYLKKNN